MTQPRDRIAFVHASGYRGRFAPSPTGRLHFGSLVAAVASYLDARAVGGQWLLRIEDLDPPREVPGAADLIIGQIEAYGFEWDGAVLYQRDRDARYVAALEHLARQGLTYPCSCSRQTLTDGVYPGTCAAGLIAGRRARATRFRVGTGTGDLATLGFDDVIQGRVEQTLATDIGDFVLKRADGPYAYQLAVVVDDAEQGITTVVRGADLLDSTPRQIALQHALGYGTPTYLHVSVATTANGEKLSKQTRAPSLDVRTPAASLHDALVFLGQPPPMPRQAAVLIELWAWAIAHWSRDQVPRQRASRVAVDSALAASRLNKHHGQRE